MLELFIESVEDYLLNDEAEELQDAMDDAILNDGTDIDLIVDEEYDDDDDDDSVEYLSDSDADSVSEIEDAIDDSDIDDDYVDYDFEEED